MEIIHYNCVPVKMMTKEELLKKVGADKLWDVDIFGDIVEHFKNGYIIKYNDLLKIQYKKEVYDEDLGFFVEVNGKCRYGIYDPTLKDFSKEELQKIYHTQGL